MDWTEGAITDLEVLRRLYPPTHPVAAIIQIDHLNEHCREIVARSPFVVLGTANPDGTADASPKGGPPGFVTVLDDHHLAVPDLPGNYRLDGLSNVVRTAAVGLLFIIPGRGDTLRVNGTGTVVTNPAVLERCRVEGQLPVTALVVRVREAFPHCGKAFLRSGLWDPSTWPDRAELQGLPRFGDPAVYAAAMAAAEAQAAPEACAGAQGSAVEVDAGGGG